MMPRHQTEMIAISDIKVGEARLRALQSEKVDDLVESLRDIGQLQPICVCHTPKGSGAMEPYTLVFGLQRLEAMKKLGKRGIRAGIASDLKSADKRRLAEIAENLHRADLTALERSNHIAE